MAKERSRRCFVPIPPEELVDLFLKATPKERERDFWTVKKVANLLDKDDSTVRQMIARGDLSAIKIGGTIRIYMPSLVEWLKVTAAAA